MSFSRMESVQQAVGLQFWGIFFEVFRATTRDTLQDCFLPLGSFARDITQGV